MHALREGLFRADSVEDATLYLHMAELLGKVPAPVLRELQRVGGSGCIPVAGVKGFQLPEQLYARACAINPHAEAFSQWMRWALKQSVPAAEDVARKWNVIRSEDLEPRLLLMKQAEKRSAISTALSHLAKAERIDAKSGSRRAVEFSLQIGGFRQITSPDREKGLRDGGLRES